MLPPSLITEPRIRCRVEVTSKKRLLESLAELLATAGPDCSPAAVFDLLNERERLGSTGLGEGIALPHARIEGIDQAVGAFVQLSQGVSFDAPDDRPVDLAFGLLVPQEATDAHLSLLAGLAERFSHPPLRAALRAADNASTLLKLLQSPS
ncbi:MAG: PTS sugar transporter subunit IIA [Halochromatium sp.]|nr:PTS sugar transporter subunit IIA [Halochromatium sp.]